MLRNNFKKAVGYLLKKIFRIEIIGEENLRLCTGSTIIIPNHVSILDGVLIELYVNIKKSFIVEQAQAEKTLFKFFLSFVEYFTVNMHNTYALKHMLNKLKSGGNCVMFPEGRITVTSGIMKIQAGAGIIADRGGYEVLPVWMSGPEKSIFSYTKHLCGFKWFPKIKIYIGKPGKLQVNEEIKGRYRRELLALEIYKSLERLAFESTYKNEKDIFETLVETACREGFSTKILQDQTFQSLTYRQIVLGALILGKKIKTLTKDQKYVGYMLPSVNGSVVTYMAFQAYGITPAILNFSSGLESLKSTAIIADLKHVITSRKFIENGNLQEVVNKLSELVQFIYLEDIRENLNLYDKIEGKLKSYFPIRARKAYKKSRDADATVLFTSGSEGRPKGVVLSVDNILANISQIMSRWDFNSTDKVFNALPIFHCFGLVMGTLYPLIKGVKLFMYPSPLHYRIVPQLIYETDSTIFISTDTFLNGYARKADPYDFHSLRVVVAGAEKLKSATRALYCNRFGIRVIEGYGATEASPVVSCNTPMHNSIGSVGRILSGMSYRLDEVPGFDGAGTLVLKGSNVMKGYLKFDQPGVLEPADEWYDTGDIVEVDERDFITIRGRAKRFVKIGGEMVSLNAVEILIQKIKEDNIHAVISIPSEKKGEEIILITEAKDLSRKEIVQFVREAGESELLIPRKVIYVEKIPILSTGKIDYPSVKDHLLEELLTKKKKPAET